ITLLGVVQAPFLRGHGVTTARIADARLPVVHHRTRSRLPSAAAAHLAEALTLPTQGPPRHLPLGQDVAVVTQLTQRVLTPLSVSAATKACSVVVDRLGRHAPLPRVEQLRRITASGRAL